MSEQQQLKVLLKETISLLCKNGMSFRSNIYIQGLLAVTVDENDIFVIQLDETIKEVHEKTEQYNEVAEPEEVKTLGSVSEQCTKQSSRSDISVKCDQEQLDDIDTRRNESDDCGEGESLVCIKMESPQEYGTCLDSSADDLHEESHEAGEISNVYMQPVTSASGMQFSSRRQQKRARHRLNLNDSLIQYTVTRERMEYRPKRKKSAAVANASNSQQSGDENESYSWATDQISTVEMSAAMAAGSVHAGFSGYQHDQSALGAALPAISDVCNGDEYSSMWYRAKDPVGKNKSSIHVRRVLRTRSICDALIKHFVYPSVFIPSRRVSAFRIVWPTVKVSKAWTDIYHQRAACDKLICTVQSTQFFFSSICVLHSKHRPLQPIRPAISYYWVGNRDLNVAKDIGDLITLAELNGASVKPVQVQSGESDVNSLFKKGARALAGPLFIVLKDYDNEFVINKIEKCVNAFDESKDSESKRITQLVVVNSALVDGLTRGYQSFTSEISQLPLGLQTGLLDPGCHTDCSL